MSQIQRDRLSKAELELEAKEKGIVLNSKYTKQELIDMLDELESTKETVRKQQEEIDELKSKFAEQEKRKQDFLNRHLNRNVKVPTPSIFKYEEYWRKYVLTTTILPWICTMAIIGLIFIYSAFWINTFTLIIIAYFIMSVNITFAVLIPLMFYWPFTRKYGRHYGRYIWSWYSIVTQVFTIIVVAIMCTVVIGFFFIPSVYKLNIAIAQGRKDRAKYNY